MSESSDFVIHHQGWLYKKGELVPNWKKRWFILANEHYLAYFVSPKPRFPKGVIPLQGCRILQDTDRITGKSNSFIIRTVLGRDFWIYSDSRAQTSEWVKILLTKYQLSSTSSSSTNGPSSSGVSFASSSEESSMQSIEQFKKKLASLSEKERKRIMKENWERKSATLTRRIIAVHAHCQVFGEKLATVCCRDGHDIPIVLQKVFDFLETKGLETEGLFRIPGSKDEIDHIKSLFDTGVLVDLDKRDVHTVSGLLKQYLRDLPEPLVSFSLYDQFIAAERYLSEDEPKLELIRQLVGQLPKENRRVLYKLCRFLFEVSTKSDVNAMTTSNLAIVFAPNIFVAPGNDMFQPMREAPYTLSLTKRLIENSSYIFKSIPSTEDDGPLEFEEVELDEEGVLAVNQNNNNNNNSRATQHGHHHRSSVRTALRQFNESELVGPRTKSEFDVSQPNNNQHSQNQTQNRNRNQRIGPGTQNQQTNSLSSRSEPFLLSNDPPSTSILGDVARFLQKVQPDDSPVGNETTTSRRRSNSAEGLRKEDVEKRGVGSIGGGGSSGRGRGLVTSNSTSSLVRGERSSPSRGGGAAPGRSGSRVEQNVTIPMGGTVPARRNPNPLVGTTTKQQDWSSEVSVQRPVDGGWRDHPPTVLEEVELFLQQIT